MPEGTGTWFGTSFAGPCGIRTRGEITPLESRCFIEFIVSSSRPKIESIAENIATKPIIGALSMIIRDWIPLIDEYYYCGCYLILFFFTLMMT